MYCGLGHNPLWLGITQDLPMRNDQAVQSLDQFAALVQWHAWVLWPSAWL